MFTFNLILFITSVSILFFILRYRVHVHIEYQPRTSTKTKRRLSLSNRERFARPTQSKASDVEPITQPPAGMQHAPEIAAVLVAQGLKKTEARSVANRVCASEETDFTVLLRRAIQEAA
jgi:hypothetical protein